MVVLWTKGFGDRKHHITSHHITIHIKADQSESIDLEELGNLYRKKPNS
jgi:hypothetical protein